MPPDAAAPPPAEAAAPPAASTPSEPTRRRPVWSGGGVAQAVPPPPASPPPDRGGFAAHAEPPAPPPPAPQAAVPSPAPAQSFYAPQFAASAAAPAPRRKVPTWLLTIAFALAFGGLVFGVYWLVNRTPAKPSAVVENPAAKPGAAVNPIQRYIEISGVRFVEDPKHKDRTMVRFLVTNHSDAEFTGLAGNVTIWGSTHRSEEDAEGTFTFHTDLKSGESKELTEDLTTKKKIYELPDWQNVTTDVQITAPSGQ